MSLVKFLAVPLSIKEHDYAIIDRAIYHEIDEDFPSLEMVTPVLQAQAHLYPYLIPLKSMTLRAWEKFNTIIAQQLANLETPISSLLLKTDQIPSELCSRLANYLTQTIENKNYILRYYDPRVLIQLSWMYSAEELIRFYSLTGVSEWTFYFNNQWNTLILEHKKPNINSIISPQLNYQQFARISFINQLISKYKPIQSLDDYLTLSKLINNALVKAEIHYHFSNKNDQSIFVQHSLLYGEDFDLTPTMQKVLKGQFSRDSRYGDRVASFNHKDWQRVMIEQQQLIKKEEDNHGTNM